MSSSASSTSTAAATSTSAAATLSAGSNLKVVGIVLAISSGCLIGSSFVFKKKGLQSSQGHAGEGVAYLKSPLWWIGMTMMIVGELCNFAAYAFIEALVVTPLGALSVVICAILSSIFLNEKLTFFGWLGCSLCIIGSIIIALNGPQEASVGQIQEFRKLFLAPGFLAFAGTLIAASLVIIFVFAPKYGKDSMLWYIAVCSMIGGISVSCTTGLGAAIVTTVGGDNQFKHWFIYFLFGFVAVTLVTEVYYLNVALALFNTAMVTPTYYVMFSFCSMVATVVLFQGLKASASQILTIVLAFLVICVGITILQMSKVDPMQLSKLDRRSTILLQAARNHTETMDEKSVAGVEDPGIDTLRGSFGAVGSIIRARSARRMSQSSGRGVPTGVRPRGAPPFSVASNMENGEHFAGMTRHQLYDAPVPRGSVSDSFGSPRSQASIPLPTGSEPNRRPTIKFDSRDVVHSYHPPGTGDNSAFHEHRNNISLESNPEAYPPVPSRTQRTLSTPETPRASNTTTMSSLQQTASMPDFLREEELEVRTAPPMFGAQFLRRDARDVFESEHNTGAPVAPFNIDAKGVLTQDARDVLESSSRSTPLTTFPTSSDSTGNSGRPHWYNARDDADEQEREKERATRKHPKHGKYPKGEDDGDESMSLWQRQSLDEAPPPGGIRLVQPSSNGRF